MPPDSPDGPLPDDADVPTDEALPDHAALIALYFESLPRRPIMIGAAPED